MANKVIRIFNQKAQNIAAENLQDFHSMAVELELDLSIDCEIDPWNKRQHLEIGSVIFVKEVKISMQKTEERPKWLVQRNKNMYEETYN